MSCEVWANLFIQQQLIKVFFLRKQAGLRRDRLLRIGNDLLEKFICGQKLISAFSLLLLVTKRRRENFEPNGTMRVDAFDYLLLEQREGKIISIFPVY